VQAVTISITKTQGTKLRGEPTGMADLKPIYPLWLCYRPIPLEWQTDRFIRNMSCEAIWWNKLWNEKIHGWFHSHFLNVL